MDFLRQEEYGGYLRWAIEIGQMLVRKKLVFQVGFDPLFNAAAAFI